MKRLAAPAVLVIVALSALSACGSTAIRPAGIGPAAPTTTTSTPPTTLSATTTTTAIASGTTSTTTAGSGGSPSGTSGGSPTTAGVPAPLIVQARDTCVITSYENLPGQSHVPLYSPQLSWNIEHATGMALSIDNPGLVGSYGTY